MPASKPVKFGNRSFPSQKEAKAYGSDLVNNKIGFCERGVRTFKPEYFEPLLDILKNHPDYEEKSSKMTDIKIVPNKMNGHKETRFINNDGTETDISWAKFSITGKKETEEQLLTKSMRTSVDPQIIDYRNTAAAICAFCAKITNLHVDHDKLFVEIKTDFLEIMKAQNEYIPTKFRDFGRCNRKCFLEEDAVFEQKWKDYHLKEATLRILCQQCNLRRTKKY